MSETISFQRRDGFVELFPSEDAMLLEGNFYPPIGGGELLTVEYLEKLLEQTGVISGILWDSIQEAVFTCNTEHKSLEKVVMAHGRLPEDEIPSHVVLRSRFSKKKPIVTDSPTADFKAVRSYSIVRKDELLGKEEPARSGKIGLSIYGKEIGNGKKGITLLAPGKNIRSENGSYYSGKDGHLVVEGGEFRVEEVLEIQGDVDFSVGHIEYPSDVVIHGEIKDGFRIVAAGGVACMNTVDASDIICKKDFFAKAGVLGRERGIVRVGGKAEAKFFENCTVEALSDIVAKGGCYHCSMSTLGVLDLGEKGRFVGGSARCGKDMIAGTIGNEAQALTEIFGGINFVMERRYLYTKDKYQEIVLTLQNLEQAIKLKPSSQLLETRNKLKKAADDLQKLSMDLFGRVFTSLDASVSVYGQVHPGTIIHLGGASLSVDKEKKRVRFVFDRSTRKVKEEALTKK